MRTVRITTEINQAGITVTFASAADDIARLAGTDAAEIEADLLAGNTFEVGGYTFTPEEA